MYCIILGLLITVPLILYTKNTLHRTITGTSVEILSWKHHHNKGHLVCVEWSSSVWQLALYMLTIRLI